VASIATASLRLSLAESWQYERSKNPNDGNDAEQFQDREGSGAPARGIGFHYLRDLNSINFANRFFNQQQAAISLILRDFDAFCVKFVHSGLSCGSSIRTLIT